VVVDATFREDARRRAFADLGRRLAVPVVVFVCEACPEVVHERLAARTGDPSDADRRVYEQLCREWEPPAPDLSQHTVAVSTDPGSDPLAAALAALGDRGLCG
jgi:predicted kinase